MENITEEIVKEILEHHIGGRGITYESFKLNGDSLQIHVNFPDTQDFETILRGCGDALDAHFSQVTRMGMNPGGMINSISIVDVFNHPVLIKRRRENAIQQITEQ